MYFIDVQGTLISDVDKTPLPYSVEFLHYLNRTKTPFVIVTNNTKQENFREYLHDLGFEFEHYLDPLMVLDEIVTQKVAVFGTDEFKQIIQRRFEIDYTNPKYVILSVGRYDSEDFSLMIELLLRGAKLIAMHETSIYVSNAKRYPAVGAIAKMLQYATNKDYEVVGKPSKRFFDKARHFLDVPFDQITMISDDLVGDLLGAQKLGMKTILTLTGKIKNKDEINASVDMVIDSLKELL
ncbi:MAG: HAD-IIA family hydrolase [Epsilonproteobacteria bacterium]|nr:HAD-IIA family hydrolase [Campylobacterota bacterium]